MVYRKQYNVAATQVCRTCEKRFSAKRDVDGLQKVVLCDRYTSA